MKSLGKKVMANFITRSTQMQVARGFYNWVDTTNNWNKKCRLLKMCLTYWMKTDTARAFRIWAQQNFKAVEIKLKLDLAEKETIRKNLERQGQHERLEQEKEHEQLKSKLQKAQRDRDNMQNMFERAFETHCGRVNNNVYIEKRRNILKSWLDYVRREKNAVNVIGAIARRTLRIEVFQRIRMVARENYLDNNARRILQNFFNMSKHGCLKKAFSRWRQNSFKLCVAEKTNATLRLEQTKVKHELETVKIKQAMNTRAEHVMNSRSNRKVLLNLKEMTKFLAALRTKSHVLQQNLQYLNGKRACQKWFMRTQITLMLRRRNQQVEK